MSREYYHWGGIVYDVQWQPSGPPVFVEMEKDKMKFAAIWRELCGFWWMYHPGTNQMTLIEIINDGVVLIPGESDRPTIGELRAQGWLQGQHQILPPAPQMQ